MGNPVWLVGARQSGKTEALLRIAAYALIDGECVLWCGPGRTQDDDAFLRMTSHLEHYHPDLIEQIWHTNGQQRIRTTSGGMMYFGPQAGVEPGMVVADDISADAEFLYPDARVYKATC